MYRKTLITITAATIALCGQAFASEIYKWVDEDGNVHYVDRPTGNPAEERVDVLSARTDKAAVRANYQARLERNSERREQRQKDRSDAADAAADAAATQEKRQEECTQHRARLESYLRSQRLYREDESGERVYLDEAEIMEARARVQEKIQETCN